MSILDQIRQRAASNPQHIVLPEGEDPRTAAAASFATRQRLARITILGDEEKVRAAARQAGADLGGIELIDHRRAGDFEKMVSLLYERRRARGMMIDEARNALRDPLYYGNLMVRAGRADGSVAGATNTTSHTVRAALHCIGVRPGFKLVSSFFLMALRDQSLGSKGAMIFADCGVVIEPSAAELAEIAIASADSCRALLGAEPRVAMLSFSTKGSASHRLIDKVVEATRTVRARAPEIERGRCAWLRQLCRSGDDSRFLWSRTKALPRAVRRPARRDTSQPMRLRSRPTLRRSVRSRRRNRQRSS